MSDQVIINDEFKADVVEAEEALDALRNGEVDVIIGKKYPLVVLADWVRAEMEKAATEWQATFDAIPEGICIMDEDQKIVQSNEGMARLFGRKVKDMVGQYCWEVVHGTTGPIKGCPCQRMKKTCQPGSLEVVEGQRCLKLSVYPIADDKKTSTRTVHIFQDITDYKKAEDERNQLLVQLFQAQKLEAICTLAGGIAHDFNNILSAIIGYAEFIQNEVTPDSKIGKDITQVISSSKRATDLVRQILTFSRKTEGKRLPFRPHLLVKEALEMLRATLPATINLEEDVDSDCGFVLADPTSIHQIVVNLCTNARQAMSNDKGTLRVSLRDQQVRTEDIPPGEMSTPGDFVVLSVSDTGCGMDQATMDRLFEPYFTTKEVGTGTGLGLAVIHGIVRNDHGFVTVESRPGEGSTFSVYLPVVEEAVNAPSISPEQKRIRKGSGGRERLLVVDDEPLLVEINKKRLENLGYKVTGLSDSRKALKVLRTRPGEFDLLITDQAMPGITGEELAKAVLEIKPSMPIIMCTGHSDIVPEKKAKAQGITKYVFKPIHKNELLDAVREVLKP